MFTDTHAHLTSPEMLADLDGVIARARSAQITRIINICTDEKSLDAGLSLHSKQPWIAQAAAATPHDVAIFGEPFFNRVEQEAKKGSLVAIGETGLDYYYEHAPKEVQKEHLLRYIALAKELNLPLIFHCREAFDDLFSLTDTHPSVLHCFTGTLEEAKRVIERGWYLSLSGIVTFKKAEELRKVASYVPIDQLLIETDCPYLAPQKCRGKRCEPAFLIETARLIAELKSLSLSELAAATTANAARLFSLL